MTVSFYYMEIIIILLNLAYFLFQNYKWFWFELLCMWVFVTYKDNFLTNFAVISHYAALKKMKYFRD